MKSPTRVCPRIILPPLTVLLLHGVLSLMVDAYSAAPSTDVPMHFAGGAAVGISLTAVIALAGSTGIIHVRSAVVRSVLIVLGVISVAVAWEFMEFAADAWLDTGAQKSLADTMGDLAAGICGGAFVAILALRRRKRRVRGTQLKLI